MDQGVSGKAKTAAKCHQKKWRLSPDKWKRLAKLCAVLQVRHTSDHYLICSRVNACCTFQTYQDATLEFSQLKVPTISKVLPLFKTIQQHLEDALKDPDLAKEKSGQKYQGLKRGLKFGLEKALVGDYPLLGTGECPITCALVFTKLFEAVLHPSIRLAYFEDTTRWDTLIPAHAWVLLKHLYEVYKADGSPPSTAMPNEPLAAAVSIFLGAIQSLTPAQQQAAVTEIEAWLAERTHALMGMPSHGGWLVDFTMWSIAQANTNYLTLWKHATDLPVLMCIACDILAIPGVSISVEHLFSSCKHTLSDLRSSLTAESASKTMVAKEWLKRGFGAKVNYLDDISTCN